MTWRVRIEQDALIDGIAVQIARRLGDGGSVELLRFQPDREVIEGGAAMAMPTPSLSIDDELGRALLDALAAHYGGTTGGRQQRADYEHERGRVDRLIAHLTGNAES